MEPKEKLRELLKAKYTKRIPKPGGGYRYFYAKDKDIQINKDTRKLNASMSTGANGVLSQAESHLKDLKEINGKISEIKDKGNKEQLSLPGFAYNPESKDFIGRTVPHRYQIQDTLKEAEFFMDKPNYGYPMKEVIQKEINTLSKRKRISAENKKKLSLYKDKLKSYDKDLNDRKTMIESAKKYREIEKKVENDIKPLETQREKLQDKLNGMYKKLKSEEKQAEMKKMMNKILYGINRASTPENNLLKANIQPWQLPLLKLDNRRM